MKLEFLAVVVLIDGVEAEAEMAIRCEDELEATQIVLGRVSKYQGAVKSWAIYGREIGTRDDSLNEWMARSGYRAA